MPDREQRDDLSEALRSDETWGGPSPHVRDAVLAAIAAEVAAAPVVPITPDVASWATRPEAGRVADVGADADVVVALPRHRARGRYGFRTSVATVAAVLVVAIGLFGSGFLTGATDRSRPFEDEFVLEGIGSSNTATASVGLISGPSGWEIRLLVDGLPPAEKGSYYAAWLESPDEIVPIGSFHLRGGIEEVVLWAGVNLDRYDTVVITVQSEAEPPLPSESVVMTGSR